MDPSVFWADVLHGTALWKDPKAAEKPGMPMVDYVIGGMDRHFKLELFHMLHAAEEAGLSHLA